MITTAQKKQLCEYWMDPYFKGNIQWFIDQIKAHNSAFYYTIADRVDAYISHTIACFNEHNPNKKIEKNSALITELRNEFLSSINLGDQ